MYKNDDSDHRVNNHKRASITSSAENGVELLDESQSQIYQRDGDEPQRDSTEDMTQSANTNEASESDSHTILDEDDAPANVTLLQTDEKRGTLKRLLVAAGVVISSLLVLAVIGYFWLLGGRRDEMSYKVKNSQSEANAPSITDSAQGITQEEIAREMKRPDTTNNLPANPGDTAAANLQLQSGNPITDRLPNDSFSATVVSPNTATSQQITTGTTAMSGATQAASTTNGAPTGNTEATVQTAKDSRSTAEHSIRINSLQAQAANNAREPISSSSKRSPSVEQALDARAGVTLATTTTQATSTTTVPLPPLGTMLPVRTLGTVFTLRNDSYVRMQLTRDMTGHGWHLPRGTEFYGTLRGAELDTGRAFVSLIGFIDPSTNRLVRLQGNLLGGDGADGVRGRKHKLSSGWSRALKMAGAGAVDALSTVAAGIGRRPVYIGDIYGKGAPRAINPLAQEISGIAYGSNRRDSGFIEVPANSAGYLLVMTSPREIQGVEADTNMPTTELQHLADASAPRVSAQLSEQEIAELMTNGSHDDIRPALPRMSPEMRRIAEAVLSQR